MDFDLDALAPRDGYKMLSALVVPRPIAWVTTRNDDGTINAAPYSFFNLMGHDPHVVALGLSQPGDRALKDTAHNIRREGRFVVNVVDEAGAPAMHQTSGAYAPGVSEVEAAGLALTEAPRGDVPRLADAPAALACREHTTLLVGNARVVLGIVDGLYVRDDLVDAERFYVRQEALLPVGRLGGGLYARTREHLDLGPRPTPAEVREQR